jgi:hypothetical protein
MEGDPSTDARRVGCCAPGVLLLRLWVVFGNPLRRWASREGALRARWESRCYLACIVLHFPLTLGGYRTLLVLRVRTYVKYRRIACDSFRSLPPVIHLWGESNSLN